MGSSVVLHDGHQRHKGACIASGLLWTVIGPRNQHRPLVTVAAADGSAVGTEEPLELESFTKGVTMKVLLVIHTVSNKTFPPEVRRLIGCSMVQSDVVQSWEEPAVRPRRPRPRPPSDAWPPSGQSRPQ